jgi:VCBS repeat-containing protein
VVDAYNAAKDAPLDVPAPGVLGNDTDVDNDPLQATLVTPATNGNVTLNADGSFTYTPNAGFTGDDGFTYRAGDASAQSAETMVAIHVADGPVLPLTFAPIADALVRSSRPTTNYGGTNELRLKTDATTYRSYLKFDLSGLGAVEQATLRLYVIDASPVGGSIHAVSNDYSGSGTPWEESGITWDNAPAITAPALSSLANVSINTWVEFDVTAAINGNGIHSFGMQSASTNSVRYSTKEGANPPELLVTATGSGGGGNTAPVANADSFTVDEDAVLTVSAPGVLVNDQDDDGDGLTAAVTSSPSNGELSLNPDGSFSYTPNDNFNGSDSFSYRASDGRGGSDTANVQITVYAKNDAPVAVADAYFVAQDGFLSVNAPGVLDNDSDIDGDALSAVLETPASNGVASLAADGSFTYSPDSGFSGSDFFSYTAHDAESQSQVVQVSVNVGGAPSTNVAFEEVQNGSSIAAASVSTASALGGAPGDLYVAAVSYKPNRVVTAVTGLGLNWTRVRAQCGGRHQTGVEVWVAQGTPASGSVSATLDNAAKSAVISVARYSGADASSSIGNIVSGNSLGVDGACDGGVDGASYAFDLAATREGGLLFGAAAMRSKSHTPGTGWNERSEVHAAGGGDASSVAIMDQSLPPGVHAVDGVFSSAVDWAVVAFEILPGVVSTKGAESPAVDEPRDPLAQVTLYRPFPNPTSQGTSIAFELGSPTQVDVVVYNARGQRVRTLSRGRQAPGRQLLRWDGRNESGIKAPSGVYFIRMRLGGEALTRKVVLQR